MKGPPPFVAVVLGKTCVFRYGWVSVRRSAFRAGLFFTCRFLLAPLLRELAVASVLTSIPQDVDARRSISLTNVISM